MKKVHVCDDVILAGHLHSLLESNAISCHLRNASLSGGIGDLPINACWPEIWVNDDRDVVLAQQIINGALSRATAGQSWSCQCGEFIEGQFDVCWSCGGNRPEKVTSCSD